MTLSFLIAGFGGQGLLFSGKFLAHKGMLEGKEVSWLPSYGPEMRGGTANCSVIISDEPIGSPIVDAPEVLMAMNLPSLERFEEQIIPGGYAFCDSSMIDREIMRTDIHAFCIPATQMARDIGNVSLANMILTGKMLKELNMYDPDTIETAMGAVVSARHQSLLTANLQALRLGAES